VGPFEADYLSFLRYGVPALIGQLVYMNWISRARTLPLFTEAAQAIGAFTITATLLSAIVKPFGRPFKITNKGGDRSAARVHLGLASIFGAITLASAACIVWAFISPNGATEISPQDLFNLLWAGVAMLIGFVAFVICFERPRDDIAIAMDVDTVIAAGERMTPCRLTRLSTSGATLETVSGDPDEGDLYVPGVGWMPLENDRNGLISKVQPTLGQRRLIVQRLTLAPLDVANTASMPSALAGLFRRGADL
jgi:cellulose synthase (UDP-forming)